MLEHVFPPFLACCADAVMRSKRNVAIDDEEYVMVMTIRFVPMKLRGGYEIVLFLMTLE